MGKLIIAAGPSASGKSTWAQVWEQGSDGTDRRRLIIEEANSFHKIEKLLDGGFDVLVTVNTKHELEAMNFSGEDA